MAVDISYSCHGQQNRRDWRQEWRHRSCATSSREATKCAEQTASAARPSETSGRKHGPVHSPEPDQLASVESVSPKWVAA